ncbi:hypothetical protein KEM56_006112 [Ascosphaera pollenicola]|nr:hypothetical protein KEM56_006112 [Ascosphaera pollenicola]
MDVTEDQVQQNILTVSTIFNQAKYLAGAIRGYIRQMNDEASRTDATYPLNSLMLTLRVILQCTRYCLIFPQLEPLRAMFAVVFDHYAELYAQIHGLGMGINREKLLDHLCSFTPGVPRDVIASITPTATPPERFAEMILRQHN